ncbi:MAG TPA: hypothetical protein PKD09_20305 [Aggregatilinea sp.]|uniref:peptidase MA family metallohydrolase n=1 Tax=Aggregatilinea sp. TaxID=2806333 RepID=UPI002B5C37C4|nr:hypothetical protein [Aggregatilinea sp.]HML24011.1 hypothetical protein [Aggregatilinea sp.]
MEHSRSRFISIWIMITLLMMALLAMALFSFTQTEAAGSDADAVEAVVEQMQAAVLAGDREAYTALVDWSDPVFTLEHTRWIDDWAEDHPVDEFALNADRLVVIDDTATAELMMRWSVEDDPQAHQAQFPVTFTHGEDGPWRYAGEQWTATEGEDFLVLAVPGLEDAAALTAESFPAIWDYATDALDFTPDGTTEIKLYGDGWSLVATVELSLPLIAGWNEPGEALKLVGDTATLTPERIDYVLAHELTHKISFEMAGQAHGAMPWWLEEGLAEQVAAGYTNNPDDSHLKFVRDLVAQGTLVPWDEIANWETTPVILWAFVYPQGEAFVDYVTETFGADARNEWVMSMAQGTSLDDATETVLGMPFDQLDGSFTVWVTELAPAPLTSS